MPARNNLRRGRLATNCWKARGQRHWTGCCYFIAKKWMNLMPTLDWNKWANGWSASFPKNQMWGAIRSGENDPETGEPLYRFNDKPSTSSMSPELADVMAEHRFVAPAVVDSADDEHCFCGWVGESWGDHYQGKLSEFAGDHNAEPE